MAGSVTFQHVWKRFRRGERHNALRDLLPALAKQALGASNGLAKDEFWALRDVSFEAPHGEALGIIGPNGAGKSTVLKLLTKIMRPTQGVCALKGRIGALIEVSAGFHQDLTGRENIFLQGAIMGMSQAEIARKFDEIVEFSGVVDFIDTPVRRYSSGMNARLGFSVAAHLDPEVLIIDEVLAVGDFAFQQKAYERIQEIVNRDITVILVSHQLERVSQLCSQVVLLRHGEVAHAGPVDETIAAYLASAGQPVAGSTTSPMRFLRLERAGSGDVTSGQWIELTLSGEIVDGARLGSTAGIGVIVRSMTSGQLAFSINSEALGVPLPSNGPFTAEIELQLNVSPGIYTIETVVKDLQTKKIEYTGPWMSVKVSRGVTFGGPVQMNPRIRLDVRQAPELPEAGG